MITDNELRISNESYCRRDFYQIYPEILDLVKKITERWDPASSNESDPGVVLLKLLAFMGDKVNYNIDKNILELFMPSCTQEDSMRKLCDMMGYEMKYHQSAVTNVSFMWTGSELDKLADYDGQKAIILPAFETVLTNEDGDVTFVLLEDCSLGYRYQTISKPAIEGTLCELDINNDGILRTYNLDDNHRFYLPESQIAENGIWITDATAEKTTWKKVSNLNIQSPNSKVWKFGYDSKKRVPYIQFPEDIVELIPNGLTVKYVRTSGANGNISAKVLSKISNATTVKLANGTEIENINILDDNGNSLLTIQNPASTINGVDKETIDEAYNGFKRTVGTFDTLVTCRDYANAIYNMLADDISQTPLVSNCQAGDIRDELNHSNKVVTFDDYGLVYEDIPETDAEGKSYTNHFSLYLYPLNTIATNYNASSYQKSFQPAAECMYEIKNRLNDFKTVSHQIKEFEKDDIYVIKNYYSLAAQIATTYKVNKYEEEQILNNVATALYKNFNARNLEYGEEIPYDSLVKVIEKADNRIKMVVLEEPTIETKVMTYNMNEYSMLKAEAYDDEASKKGHEFYTKLVLKNVLAGRIPLFKYDNRFEYEYGQTGEGKVYGNEKTYYGDPGNENTPTNEFDPTNIPEVPADTSITYIATNLTLSNITDYNLKRNERVQLIAPDLRTVVTYPCYINYYLKLNNSGKKGATPCVLKDVATIDNGHYIPVLDPESGQYGSWEEALEALQHNEQWQGIELFTRGSQNITIRAGELIDEKGYKYSPLTQYPQGAVKANIFYYMSGEKDGDRPLSKGSNAQLSTYIPENTEYQLQPGDELYINYTESDNKVVDLLYEGIKDGAKIWKNGVEQKEGSIGIIRPNFNLYDSDEYHSVGLGHVYAKTKGSKFIDDGTIPGMFSLGGQEQIEMVDFVKTIIKEPTKCYWITESNLPMSILELSRISNTDEFEYILNDGEYFLYTDDNMTQLVTLGSGTRLIYKDSNVPSGQPNVKWVIENNVAIDPDDVANNGIGAFAETDWQVKKFTANTPLTIQGMKVVNLGEGDVINEIKFESGNTELNSVEWTPIIEITYNSNQKLPASTNTPISWQARALLDLNVGPNLTQHLVSTVKSKQAIYLYTAGWVYRDDNGNEYLINPEWPTYQQADYKEKVVEKYAFALTEDVIENKDIRASHLIQRSGNPRIDVHRYKTSGEQIDNFRIFTFDEKPVYAYESQEPGADAKILEMNTCDNRYTKINLSQYVKVDLPVYVPENSFGLIAIYYAKKNANANNVYLSSDERNMAFYKDHAWKPENTGFVDVINLEGNKLNIIQINKSSTISINRNNDDSGTVTIAAINIVSTDNSNYSGVNYELLGINKDKGECDSFVDMIADIDKENKFYYNCPIDNSLYIDVDDLSAPEAWFNHNNICNKFVLPELEVDSFEKIVINKSSKLSR